MESGHCSLFPHVGRKESLFFRFLSIFIFIFKFNSIPLQHNTVMPQFSAQLSSSHPTVFNICFALLCFGFYINFVVLFIVVLSVFILFDLYCLSLFCFCDNGDVMWFYVCILVCCFICLLMFYRYHHYIRVIFAPPLNSIQTQYFYSIQ